MNKYSIGENISDVDTQVFRAALPLYLQLYQALLWTVIDEASSASSFALSAPLCWCLCGCCPHTMTPDWPPASCLLLCLLPVMCPITAVTSANFRVVSSWEAAQLWVNRVSRMGLRTHLCGVPVFKMLGLGFISCCKYCGFYQVKIVVTAFFKFILKYYKSWMTENFHRRAAVTSYKQKNNINK